ncbi:MAG: HAMP domain-containing sensor histidine kinase [Gordonibacter sp.]|uniref:sensor histidine kinase n=1 Tax=Gordonibacter sp. TaxID=1968902 RepID=UPI002FC9445F
MAARPKHENPKTDLRPRLPVLRFWQKAYLITLALFLAALFGGMAFMGWQNQKQTLDSEIEKIRSEQRFVAQNLEQDLLAIEDGSTSLRSTALARSYVEHYAQNGLLLLIRQGDEALTSNLPDGLEPPAAQSGQQTWGITEANSIPYLSVSSFLGEDESGMALSCVLPLDALYAAWANMRFTLITGSTLVSVLLAAGLYVALRSLSKPLERLAATANAYAAGNLAIRARKRSDDEVGMLADSLNAMADAAERNLTETLRIADQNARMAANLSHEIRTPLTAVRGYAEYLRLADPSPEERNSALAAIVEQSERLQAVSQSMLLLSSLAHDNPEFEWIDLSHIARSAICSSTPAALDAGVELRSAVPETIPIRGDTVLLESLVANLVDNAVKACDTGGIVWVRASMASTTTDAARSAILSVTDNGRGLSPDELSRLGEPFYRPDKARSRAAGGAGLGVSLCQEIAQLHNALLTYTSKLGKGTTATVEFTAS